ncbi:MAG: V-type ATP synthase subunit E family protein [Acidaminococcaceae bacterium]
MATNKIVFKIQEEAAAEAAAILAAAKTKADASAAKIIEEAHIKAEEIREESLLAAKEAAHRQELIAELEARKDSLDSKRQLLDEAYLLAAKELAQLTDEKWKKLIIAIVNNASVTGTEKLCVPAKDFAKYKNGFLLEINADLTANGKKGQLSLAEETAPFADGILLIGKNSDVDCSFATILQEMRRKTEREVATILFGVEVSRDATAKL